MCAIKRYLFLSYSTFASRGFLKRDFPCLPIQVAIPNVLYVQLPYSSDAETYQKTPASKTSPSIVQRLRQRHSVHRPALALTESPRRNEAHDTNEQHPAGGGVDGGGGGAAARGAGRHAAQIPGADAGEPAVVVEHGGVGADVGGAGAERPEVRVVRHVAACVLAARRSLRGAAAGAGKPTRASRTTRRSR